MHSGGGLEEAVAESTPEETGHMIQLMENNVMMEMFQVVTAVVQRE